MKTLKITTLLAVVFFATLLGVSYAQKNNKTDMKTRWEKVSEYTSKRLPESALKEVNAIFEDAERAGDMPEMIKAMLHKMKFTLQKDSDEAENALVEFESFAEKAEDKADKAFLYAMLADFYGKYYDERVAYTGSERRELHGHIPDSMEEWTVNLFDDKIMHYADLSIADAEILQKTDMDKYSLLVSASKVNNDYLRPTLFDFLSYKYIETVESVEIRRQAEMAEVEHDFNDKKEQVYRNLIDFNRDKAYVAAAVYAELQLLRLEQKIDRIDDEAYLAKLKEMATEYEGDGAVVEVLYAQASYWLAGAKDGNDYKRRAYEVCKTGIKQYPTYKRIGLLENVIKNIEEKSLFVEHNRLAASNNQLKLKLKTQNLPEVLLEVYRADTSPEEFHSYALRNSYPKKLFPKRTEITKRLVTIEPDPNFWDKESEIELETGDYGIYQIRVSDPVGKNERQESITYFVVSDMVYLQRGAVDNEASFLLVNRDSGAPLSDVTVKVNEGIYRGRDFILSSIGEYKSDRMGMAQVGAEKTHNKVLIFEKGRDKYHFSDFSPYRYGGSSGSDDKDEVAKIAIFTDRSIYRPGQTLFFKSILYKEKAQTVETNHSITVTLFDVNHEKVAEKTFRTNEFGSIEGSFVLPESGLNGAYTLRSGTGSQTVWVEEYKRPTFEVEMKRPKDEVRFGEKVTVEGEAKAFAGYAVAEAEVKYRIVRVPHRWWWNRGAEKIVARGDVKSDDKGKFEIVFTPEKGKEPGRTFYGGVDEFYTYRIFVDVTDEKGETQSGESSLSVGDKSLFIRDNVPEKWEKTEKNELLVTTVSLNGEPLSTEVSYKVFEMKQSDAYYESEEFKNDLSTLRTAQEGKITSGEKLEVNLNSENSGYYKIEFVAKDNWDREVKTESFFILYSEKDKKPPVKSYSWVEAPASELNPGEKTSLKFGTSVKNSFVLYELFSGSELLERRWIRMSDEIKEFPLEMKTSYNEGVTVSITMVKDVQIFTHQYVVRKKHKRKVLTPTLSVFRDKLRPGELAEWSVHIPESVESDKKVELLVNMYDASLDAIRSHNWYFNPMYRLPYHHMLPWSLYAGYNLTGNFNFVENFVSVPHFSFSEINYFDLQFNYRHVFYATGFGGARRMMAKQGELMGAVLEESMDGAMKAQSDVMLSKAADLINMTVPVITADKSEIANEPEIQIRENFNETAFFYPQLYTDKDGNVRFSFTAPESLTRWNVMMLAHTPDLYFGQEKMEVVTQKELMVQMNLPRFVRKSDKPVLAATVVNLTDEVQSVQVRMDIINPESEEVLQSFTKENSLQIEANGSQSVEWEMAPLKDLDLSVVKIVAESEHFSDGEQKYLPVLPDKVLVTESQTMTLRANETRTYSFDSFISKLKDVDTQSYTVEFTANPAWYAVQALPTLADPQNENAIDYLTAYYANTLAAHIANANPKLKSIFEQWKKSESSRDALLSNLEKNSELKTMLLDETPWLMRAQNESEQKKQIALLFDLNRMTNQSERQLEKLLDLQQDGGGFSWFPKMTESRYITQEVLLHLARLHKMTGEKRSKREDDAIRKALAYLDTELARDFAELRKWNKDYYKFNNISNLQLFYLHMRSEYKDIPIPLTVNPAYNFYLSQAEKYWTDWTLYGQAMMAVVLHRNGKSRTADDIIKSLRENALQRDELGMYWGENRAGMFWSERPIGVQAAIIEAFAEIAGDKKELDELKIWLLKQKQAQSWDSPISTVNAIYALLNYGEDWISTTAETQITVGSKVLKPESKEAGTGYIKESLPIADLSNESGKITVQSEGGSSIGWGVAYWQYFADAADVVGQGNEMKVTKMLFVEQIIDGKKSIVPAAQAGLKRGDKLISRLVLTVDRDMEYVVLKDLRAATQEPKEQVSAYKWQDGVGYYYTIKDASTHYYFNFLPKGTYVFEEESWLNNSGLFTSGITTVQCLYAPEFVTHSSGERIVVK